VCVCIVRVNRGELRGRTGDTTREIHNTRWGRCGDAGAAEYKPAAQALTGGTVVHGYTVRISVEREVWRGAAWRLWPKRLSDTSASIPTCWAATAAAPSSLAGEVAIAIAIYTVPPAETTKGETLG
jgi:hypothetical protein